MHTSNLRMELCGKLSKSIGWSTFAPLELPSSLGGHVESQENRKLCFCTVSLALNSRLGEANRAKTKPFYSPETQHGHRVRKVYSYLSSG